MITVVCNTGIQADDALVMVFMWFVFFCMVLTCLFAFSFYTNSSRRLK